MALALLAAAAVLFLLTQPRLGATADSIVYAGVAEQIAAGEGVTYPYLLPGRAMTDFPPLYPTVLALHHPLDLGVLDWARVLHAGLYGAIAALVFILIRSATAQTGPALLGAFVVALSPDVLRTVGTAMAEPLMVALTLGGLVLLVRYRHTRSTPLLLTAATVMALAGLARWIGIVSVAAGFLAVALTGGEPRRRRLLHAVLFAAVGFLPVVLWWLRNATSDGPPNRREFVVHLISGTHLRFGQHTVTRWFAPGGVPVAVRSVVAVVVTGVIVGVIVLGLRRRIGEEPLRRRTGTDMAVIFLAGYAAMYLLGLLVVINFFDFAVRFEQRILFPAYVALLMLVVVAMAFALAALPLGRLAPVVAVAALLVFGTRGAATLTDDDDSWRQFTADSVRDSPLLDRVSSLPSGGAYYSNAPDLLYLYARIGALDLPHKRFSITAEINPRYETRMREVRDELHERGGHVVYFDALARPTAAGSLRPPVEELVDELDLVSVAEYPDGVILAPDPGADA